MRSRSGSRATLFAAVATVAMTFTMASTASATAPTQYYLLDSKGVPTDHCFTQYGYTDLLGTAPPQKSARRQWGAP